MKQSLRDVAEGFRLNNTPAVDILINKVEQADLMNGLRRQAVNQIAHICMTSQDKVAKYDRIEEIVLSLGRDLQTVHDRPTVD